MGHQSALNSDEYQLKVNSLVRRIIRDTSTCQEAPLRLTDVSEEDRLHLIDVLRGRDLPVLSTDAACG